jgi:sec-independent protein translocase protein TatC
MSATPREIGEMDLFGHLRELRRRIVISVLAILGGAIVAYSFTKEIFDFLSRPYFDAFPDNILIGTGLAEAFILKLKVAFFAGIVLASPVLFFQLWLFIAPGLYDRERRLALPFVVSTTGLFLLGVWFCYTWVFPFAFDFFRAEYLSIGVTPTVRISEHLALMIQGLVGFGSVFQLPVIAFFLGRLGVIDHRTLIGGARYAVVIIFVLSAILTPPDVLTQFLMAGPLMLLYGISIIVVRYTAARPADGESSPDRPIDEITKTT